MNCEHPCPIKRLGNDIRIDPIIYQMQAEIYPDLSGRGDITLYNK